MRRALSARPDRRTRANVSTRMGEQELIGAQDGRACADRRPTLVAIRQTASRRRGGIRPGRHPVNSLELQRLPRLRRVRTGSDCASSRLGPLRACDACSCASPRVPVTGLRDRRLSSASRRSTRALFPATPRSISRLAR